MNLNCWTAAVVVAYLGIGFQPVQAQSSNVAQRRLLVPVRLVAGESWSKTLGQGRNRIVASILAAKTTPDLAFPIRATINKSDQTSVELTIPPATPPGDYKVEITARYSDGYPEVVVMPVRVDAVTVPKSAVGRVPVILLNGWQLFCTPEVLEVPSLTRSERSVRLRSCFRPTALPCCSLTIARMAMYQLNNWPRSSPAISMVSDTPMVPQCRR